MPSDIAVAEPPVATPMMFVGIPSVPASYQQQARVQSGTVSTTWLVPISSSGFSSGISYVGTQQIDPMCIQRPIYPLSTRLPPYGGHSMPFHCSLPENNHMRVYNKVQVKLELHLAVGYQYCLNNQGLYIQCNQSILCQIFPLHLLL